MDLVALPHVRTVVLQPETEPESPTLQGWFLTTGPPGKSLYFFFLWKDKMKWLILYCPCLPGFPGSSAAKESTCNAGHPISTPGSGRSPWEGIGYPLLYSCVSLVAQIVKNLPAMRESWVQSLGWEDSVEEGTATHSSFLAWRILWTEEPDWLQFMGPQSWTGLNDFHFLFPVSLEEWASQEGPS